MRKPIIYLSALLLLFCFNGAMSRDTYAATSERPIKYPYMIFDGEDHNKALFHKSPSSYEYFQGKIYYVTVNEDINGSNDLGHTLWKINPTTYEYKKIKSFSYDLPQLLSYNKKILEVFKDRLFFIGYTPETGLEPWFMDSEGNTQIFKDIKTGPTNSSFFIDSPFMITGDDYTTEDKVWKIQEDYTLKLELEFELTLDHSIWRVETYPMRTLIFAKSGLWVKQTGSTDYVLDGYFEGVRNLVEFRGRTYFKGENQQVYRWYYIDESGNVNEVEINSDFEFELPTWDGQAANNDYLYFLADIKDMGLELLRMDYEGNVSLAQEFIDGPEGGWPEDLTNLGEKIYFSTRDRAEGTASLWAINKENTVQLIQDGFNVTALKFDKYKDSLIFHTVEKQGRTELWKISEDGNLKNIVQAYPNIVGLGNRGNGLGYNILGDYIILSDHNNINWVFDLNNLDNGTIVLSDLLPNHLNYYISELVNRSVLSGYSDGRFRPEESVTRAQMAKFVVNGLNLELDTSGDPFPDVTEANNLFPYIQTLKNLGIVSGYSDGTFKPDALLPREQAAKFVVETMFYIKGELKDAFNQNLEQLDYKERVNDIEEDNVFVDYITFMLFSDTNYISNEAFPDGPIMSGFNAPDGEKRFGPKENMTRAQMAKVIWIAQNYLK